MKAQGPHIPCYPALHLTPLSIEFHNWETARFLPGLNKMPLLLQKAEINNYTYADQHCFLCNWCLSTSTIYTALLDIYVKNLWLEGENILGSPLEHAKYSIPAESPEDISRREVERQSDNGHTNNAK